VVDLVMCGAGGKEEEEGEEEEEKDSGEEEKEEKGARVPVAAAHKRTRKTQAWNPFYPCDATHNLPPLACRRAYFEGVVGGD